MSDKKICPICGRTVNRPGTTAKYCSIECRAESDRRNAVLKRAKRNFEDVYSRKCRYCHKIFYTTVPTRKYCSTQCHNQAVLNSNVKPKETPAEREARQNRLIDEAEQCGLSYGQYMAQIRFFRKTFEELRAAHLKELEIANQW